MISGLCEETRTYRLCARVFFMLCGLACGLIPLTFGLGFRHGRLFLTGCCLGWSSRRQGTTANPNRGPGDEGDGLRPQGNTILRRHYRSKYESRGTRNVASLLRARMAPSCLPILLSGVPSQAGQGNPHASGSHLSPCATKLPSSALVRLPPNTWARRR